jgi:HipA-like protein
MRSAKILFKDEPAGLLIQHDDGSFTFHYYDEWFNDMNKPAISLTFPKQKIEYHSKYLFPFFYNMLPEGANKQAICMHHRIDPDDFFGLLLTTARHDSIGAIRVVKIEEEK